MRASSPRGRRCRCTRKRTGRGVDATTFTLLASDGKVDVTFRPCLTSDQYDELHRVVTEQLRTRKELCGLFEQLADQWHIEFYCDGGY